jgi:ribosomal protein L13E
MAQSSISTKTVNVIIGLTKNKNLYAGRGFSLREGEDLKGAFVYSIKD